MSGLEKLKKSELIEMCQEISLEKEALMDELDRLNDCYSEMESELADRINSLDVINGIKDVDWFKYQLMLHCLLTPELESFIDDYLKFNNVLKGFGVL